MFLVYTAEAHPAAKRLDHVDRRPLNPGDIAEHETIRERARAACACVDGLDLSIPVLLDTMNDRVKRHYRAPYCATVIVDFEGNLAYHAEGVSAGIQPEETVRVLDKLLAEANHS
jgi:hypothetical protein